MPTKPPRVLIAEDHRLIAELCRNLLTPEFEVVGIVADGAAMVESAVQLRPDLIVVDIAMPVLDGFAAARKVKQSLHPVKLIFLTMHNDTELAAEAFRLGASGYVLKTSTSTELSQAVRTVLNGSSYVSEGLSKDEIRYLSLKEPRLIYGADRLTERQRQVLRLLAQGKCMQEVADNLEMTVRTVAFHKYRVMQKLGIGSNAELVRYAVKNRIVAP